ncbi:MAG TPA: DUF6184 family natural product biosynthesis lipoprotein [Polyangiaceae bacterium]
MTSVPKISLILGAIALFGCDRTNDNRATEPATPIAENEVERDVDREDGARADDAEMQPASRAASATQAIAEARCARENRCENVGADRKFSSTDDCMARVRNDWRDELTARECPGGIDQSELSECLTEIRNEDCGNPFDTLGRMAACTVAEICEESVD